MKKDLVVKKYYKRNLKKVPQKVNNLLLSLKDKNYIHWDDPIIEKMTKNYKKNPDKYVLNCFCVFCDWLDNELRHRKQFVDIEDVEICSEVEELARRRFWIPHSSKYNREIDEKVNKRIEGGDRRQRGTIIDEIYEEMTKEFHNQIEEEIKRRYKNKPIEAWLKRREALYKPRKKREYKRKYQMPYPLCYWDGRNSFEQIYMVEQDGIISFAQGGTGSSGQRGIHSQMGTFFAIANAIKPINTYFLLYDSQNNFKYIDTIHNLVLCRMNFQFLCDRRIEKEIEKKLYWVTRSWSRRDKDKRGVITVYGGEQYSY